MGTKNGPENWIDAWNAENTGADAAEGADEKEAPREDFASMLEASLKRGPARRFTVGDKLRCEILVIGKEDVFVSTGTAKDGQVTRQALLDKDGNFPHKVGDSIELYVSFVKGEEIRLTPKPSGKALVEDLQDAFDMEQPVEGKVTEVVKGGFRVLVSGRPAFCPISQMDNVRIEQPEPYIGRKLEFRITKLTEGGRNIVLSRRILLDAETALTRETFLSEHRAGETVPGKVKRLEPFGAFVELAPGLEGLLHVSEIAWSRVAHPQDVLTVGQEFDVKLLKIEHMEGKTKISLSLKQLTERPQNPEREDPNPAAQTPDGAVAPGAAPAFVVGQILEGKVERKEAYGVFVRLDAKTVGLFPKSKMQDAPGVHFGKLKVGDPIQVRIAEIRPEERRISLESPSGDDGSADWKAYSQKQPAAPAGLGTLGGALGEQLKKALKK